ncbi:hypothetical protein KDL44_10930 [bacterium]|nr:hypothetical protein [bacterium]
MNNFPHGSGEPEPNPDQQPEPSRHSPEPPPQDQPGGPQPGAVPPEAAAPPQMPPQWEHAVPPVPQYQPRNTGVNGMLKGLGIACLGCIGAGAGLFGACFVVVGAVDSSTIPFVAGAGLVFVAAAVALYYLVRPRR